MIKIQFTVFHWSVFAAEEINSLNEKQRKAV